jgi:hypothetical protein
LILDFELVNLFLFLLILRKICANLIGLLGF